MRFGGGRKHAAKEVIEWTGAVHVVLRGVHSWRLS